MKHKPFSCQHCQKTFGRQDVLARHVKLHEVPASNDAVPVKVPRATPHGFSPGAAGDFNPLDFQDSSPIDEASNASTTGFRTHLDNGIDIGSSQPWNGSEDMLELLMSDFNTYWPVSLPVIQNPSQYLADPSLSSTVQGATGPGHQAMQQMSRLIADLAANLTAEIESTGITSAFLDTCMHVFFEKFTPSFPVLHKPTFLARESSSPLLLNIIALGSLFVGAKDAIHKGEALWRLAHTAVATSWQALMATKGPRDDCKGIQLVLTALLGQTYALLSKNESLRMTSQIFHGLGFYWARQCGMYVIREPQDDDIPSVTTSEAEKLEKWKKWATREVQNRAVLGHYVLDGQISQFSGYAACARHVTNPLLVPESDAAFAATTPDAWIAEMQKQRPRRRPLREVFVSIFSPGQLPMDAALSNFSIRVILEGLQSLASDVQEVNGPAVGTPSNQAIMRALIHLHNGRLAQSDPSAVENLELLVRWHSICLGIATPTSMLCRKLCAFYGIQQHLYAENNISINDLDLRVWTQSAGGLRALLHAIAVQDIVERLPLGRSHAIHLPAAIFSAATIYSAHCLAGSPTVVIPDLVQWQDVWSVEMSDMTMVENFPVFDTGVNAFLGGKLAVANQKTSTRNLLYDLNSVQITLGSISSRWGVSNEMEEILHRWINIANEEFRAAV